MAARRKARSLYQWIQAPPQSAMRRKSPKSAPRLFEWLVSEGYVEPISMHRASRAKRRTTRRRGK